MERGPFYRGFLKAHSYQDIGAGASYTYGCRYLRRNVFEYQLPRHGRYNLRAEPEPSCQQRDVQQRRSEAHYQITPAWMAGVAYDYAEGSSNNVNEGATYHQAEASTHYFLSKRNNVSSVSFTRFPVSIRQTTTRITPLDNG